MIIFALVLAGPDPARVALVAATAGFGLFCAYVTNFFAGKYGWYRLLLAFGLREPLDNAQKRLTRYGLSAIFTTYWQANLASCISTAAGILQFPGAALHRLLVCSPKRCGRRSGARSFSFSAAPRSRSRASA